MFPMRWRLVALCCGALLPPAASGQGGASVVQQAYLKAFNSGDTDAFGQAVAVSGNVVVVGAPQEDSEATGVNGGDIGHAGQSGAAYVFVREGAGWIQQAYLKASNTAIGDRFGSSVAASGDTIAVAASSEDGGSPGVNGDEADNSAVGSGAVYVFVTSGATWVQQAYIKTSNPELSDGASGMRVALDGDTLVVGLPGEDSGATGVDGDQGDNSASASGAAYVFVRDGTTWSQQAYLKASNAEVGDWFGVSVAVSGDTIVVGAQREDSHAKSVNGDQGSNLADGAGAAYVFVRSEGAWSQQAYLKATNTDAGDTFGVSVAVSGDTALVGAMGEASQATGVNGDMTDNSAAFAGAAYVFVRSGTSWSVKAYLKASSTDHTDRFGNSVSLSGDTALVGADSEDSDATGVDGDPNNDSSNTGAAYVFVRNGTGWSHQAYLKASNTGSGDDFGSAVSVSGDKAVAGAPLEGGTSTGVNGDQTNFLGWEYGAAYLFDLGVQPDTWEDLGFGLAGTSGVPLLAATGSLQPGTPGSVDLGNAKPSALCTLHVSLASTPVPFKGGLFVPFPPSLNLPLVTLPDGTRPLPFTWPAGLPPGTMLWFQFTIADPAAIHGVSLSNALKATTP